MISYRFVWKLILCKGRLTIEYVKANYNHSQKCWDDTNFPSPESMLEYQLHTVHNGHLLTPTLIRGEGGIIATHNVNDSLEIKQLVVISYSVSIVPTTFDHDCRLLTFSLTKQSNLIFLVAQVLSL